LDAGAADDATAAVDAGVDGVETREAGSDSFADGAPSAVKCLTISGSPSAIANDPTNTAVVWVGVDGVHRADLPGLDNPRPLTSEPGNSVVITSSSGSPHVFWTNPSGVRAPCTGGGDLIAGGQNDILAVSAAGAYVSWIDARTDGYRICAAVR
jgi:hypothetical protein